MMIGSMRVCVCVVEGVGTHTHTHAHEAAQEYRGRGTSHVDHTHAPPSPLNEIDKTR